MTRSLLMVAFAAALGFGCNPADSGGKAEPGDTDTGSDTGSDTETETSSEGDVICDAGEVWCFAGWVSECNQWGTGWDQTEDCEAAGLVCAAGECQDISQECAAAIGFRSRSKNRRRDGRFFQKTQTGTNTTTHQLSPILSGHGSQHTDRENHSI